MRTFCLTKTRVKDRQESSTDVRPPLRKGSRRSGSFWLLCGCFLYILVSLEEKWPVVSPLAQTPVLVRSPAPAVLLWESSALSAFSPLTASAVALPECKHATLNTISIWKIYSWPCQGTDVQLINHCKGSGFKWHTLIWPNMFSILAFANAEICITNIQTSADCLFGPSCGSRVDVSDQTAVSNAACPGWLDVLASVPMAGDLPALWAVSLSLPWLPSASSQSPRDPAESDWKRSYVHPLVRGHARVASSSCAE